MQQILHKCKCIDLGLLEYGKALTIQEELQCKRIDNEIDDVFILVEHYPVVTIGRSGGYEHLKLSRQTLLDEKTEVFDVDRGGSVTAHEPGQLVMYPIVNLEIVNNDLLNYLRLLEETIILSLSKLDINSTRIDKYSGVWIENSKIAAIGVGSRSGVTKHGIALNVNNSLETFKMINPCGLTEFSVTSVSKITGQEFAMDKMKEIMKESIEKAFKIHVIKTTLDYLL